MVKEIEVEPVTRLEGHGGLRLVLGDDGKVQDVQFNIIGEKSFSSFRHSYNIDKRRKTFNF